MNYEVGGEIVATNCKWGIIDYIEDDGMLLVIDEDGAEKYVSPENILSYNK